jgi:hypothetical protein
VVRTGHCSGHGGGDDDSENHCDLDDSLPRPVPRHPFVDGLVLIRRRRIVFTAAAVVARAGATGDSALLLWCSVGRGGECA